MNYFAREEVLTELGLAEEAALDALSFRLLRVLPIFQQVQAFASGDRFVHLFKLDKRRAEAIRPLVVSLILQRMQLVVVCLISRITFLVSLEPGLAPLALLNELWVGKCLLLLFFGFFLSLE